MSIDLKNLEIETQLVQSLEEFEEGESRTVPLVQSTTFNYTNPDTLAELFDLKKLGYFYSRLSNPTVAAFENKMAILEKGVGALAFASGQAAVTAAILTICKAGDHIVAVSTLYGGTITLLASTLKNYGIETTFVNPEASEEEYKAAFRENTKILYGETLGNPEMNTLDFEKFVKIAKEKDVPTIVDNTLASPYLCNPIPYGINIVVHSATKYIDGQGSVLGGVIVDGGNYNWDNGKFPMLVEPDASYHNMSYYKTFGNLAYIIKARANILRDMGAALSPFNAFILLRGLETLHLRMERHSENALALATVLEKNPNITWVKYSKLPSHYSYKNAEKYYDEAKKYDNGAYLSIAYLYYNFIDKNEGEKKYKIAYDKGISQVAYILGSIAYRKGNFNLANEWYLKGIEKGDKFSNIDLGKLLISENKIDEAKKYLLKAEDGNDAEGIYYLMTIYYREKIRVRFIA